MYRCSRPDYIALRNRKKEDCFWKRRAAPSLNCHLAIQEAIHASWTMQFRTCGILFLLVIWSFGLRLFWKVEQSKEQSKVEQARHCFFVDEFGNHEYSSPSRVGGCAPHPPAFLLITHYQEPLAKRTTDDLARAMSVSVTGSVTGKCRGWRSVTGECFAAYNCHHAPERMTQSACDAGTIFTRHPA